jgi:hypothetical protein
LLIVESTSGDQETVSNSLKKNKIISYSDKADQKVEMAMKKVVLFVQNS